MGRALVGPLGPCGPGPCGPPWALVGRALVGPPGHLWAGPLWAPLGPYGPGPCGPPWALMGRALMGRALVGPPWALMGRALVAPWALMGRALMGPPWASDATLREKSTQLPITYFLSIMPMRNCHIRRIHRILGVLNFDLCPAISFHLLREGEALPFPLSAGPFSSVGIGLSWPPEGSTAVDPPPPKGQQALTLFGLLQKPKISAEVPPLSDVDADKDLPRTPRGCQGPPPRDSR